ncbi:hypothetical protein AX774_g5071 [Zancudomyces culisetae]|uniref:Uncharacterized protein n=1 Tax=Zancudomyces culisetae TaxID=1213189 RepID=A0A1R1PKI8_ZANCU|nr:hypothetical protein AX774_g5071 [Zancudomyces culisetae]|eukprot:OMH81476.1 hypothetical protein AX774_g5071 [Zancudomyces culisetae]
MDLKRKNPQEESQQQVESANSMGANMDIDKCTSESGENVNSTGEFEREMSTTVDATNADKMIEAKSKHFKSYHQNQDKAHHHTLLIQQTPMDKNKNKSVEELDLEYKRNVDNYLFRYFNHVYREPQPEQQSFSVLTIPLSIRILTEAKPEHRQSQTDIDKSLCIEVDVGDNDAVGGQSDIKKRFNMELRVVNYYLYSPNGLCTICAKCEMSANDAGTFVDQQPEKDHEYEFDCVLGFKNKIQDHVSFQRAKNENGGENGQKGGEKGARNRNKGRNRKFKGNKVKDSKAIMVDFAREDRHTGWKRSCKVWNKWYIGGL